MKLKLIPSTGGDSRYGAYPNPAIWQDEKHLLFNLNAEGRSHITQVKYRDPCSRAFN
ncbi:MAG: hypothetical protein R2865_01700 [Deinococcales bacterium]